MSLDPCLGPLGPTNVLDGIVLRNGSEQNIQAPRENKIPDSQQSRVILNPTIREEPGYVFYCSVEYVTQVPPECCDMGSALEVERERERARDKHDKRKHPAPL